MKTAERKKIVSPLMVLLLCAALVVVVGAFGFSMASANNDPSTAETLGFFKTTSASSAVGQLDSQSGVAQSASDENGMNVNGGSQSVYTTSTGFDISAAANQTDARIEAERRAAEEAVAAADREAMLRAYFNKAEWDTTDTASQLETVDWTVGKEAFVSEWGDRIDTYLSGTNLAGYGATFAEAAWENGIDPRWSPAISNTESGNGSNCFLSHNAWGWGESSWGNWEDAIWSHVSGLAEKYGYSLTYSCAAKYCPPNTQYWYSNTLAQMQKI